jgi:hypothetical protein
MAIETKLKIAGLFTNTNAFSGAPEGALSAATNVVVTTGGRLEPRRGIRAETASLGASGVPLTVAYFGNGRIVNYYESNPASSGKLAYSTAAGGAWTDYSGTYFATDPSLYVMKFVEAHQNLYFTTSVGLKVLTSLTSTPTIAGVVAPCDLKHNTAYSGLIGGPGASGSWLPKGSSVGYRALLGIRDANGNLKVSAPTGRYVVINPSDANTAIGGLVRTLGTTVTVTTTTAHGFKSSDQFTLDVAEVGPPAFGLGPFDVVDVISTTSFSYSEAGVNGSSASVHVLTSGTKKVALDVAFQASSATTSHFVRLYRTLAVASTTTDPGDEHFQIYERRLTSSEVSAGLLTVSDTTPESSLYSTPLYTNPKTGFTISEAAELPPISKDVALWQDRLWWANTTSKHRYTLQIVGVGTPSGVQQGDVLVIGGIPFHWQDKYAGAASAIYSNVFFTTALSTGSNIVFASQQLITAINTLWRAGTIPFRASYLSGMTDAPGRILIETDAPSTTPFYIGTTRAASYAPVPPVSAVVANTSARVGTTVTVNTSTSHGFVTGDQIYLSSLTPLSAFPLGVKTITVTSATRFTYTEAGTATSFDTTYLVHKLDQKSDNNARPNGIMYSRFQEPEAAPTLNFLTVGAKNKEIKRILALRDKLFVFKEDGIFVVAGTAPNLAVDCLDPTVKINSADSAVTLGNVIYAMTNQGVVSVSESGVTVISTQIEGDVRLTFGTTNTSYGVAYETERLYILGVKSSTVLYVYNYINKAWTTWSMSDQTFRHGAVDPYTDVLGFCGLTGLSIESKTSSGYQVSYDHSDHVTAPNITSVSGSTFQTATTLQVGTYFLMSTGATGLVTANPSLNTYTFILSDSSPAAGTGVASAYDPISTVVRFVRSSFGQPAVSKHFKEVHFHFADSNLYSPTLSFNFHEANAVTVTLPVPTSWFTSNNYVQNIRTLVPLAFQRGNYLQPGFTIVQGAATWALEGFSIDADITSQRVNR